MKRKVFAIAMALIMVFSTAVFAYADTDSGISTYDTSDITFVTNRTTWVLDTNNDDYVYYNNGWNSSQFVFSRTYDSLKSGTTYRIKCVCKDYINDSSHTRTFYSNSF